MDSDGMLRHLAFFEELGRMEETDGSWRSVSAGLVVMRLVDQWIADGPTASRVEAWGVSAVVDPRIGEIESPGLGLSERGVWLRQVMSSSWSELDQPLQEWRQRVADALASTTNVTRALLSSSYCLM